MHSLTRSLKSTGKQGVQEGTNKQIYIATYRLKLPRSPFSENEHSYTKTLEGKTEEANMEKKEEEEEV